MGIKLLTFDLDHTLWAPENALAGADKEMYAWLTQHYPQVTELYSPQALTDYRLALAAQNPQLSVKVSAMRIEVLRDRKSTRLNSSHVRISYAVFCLKKKKK